MYPHQLQVHLVPLALIPIPSGTFTAGLTFWHKEMVGASKSHQKPRLRQRSNQLSLVTCLIQWVVEEGKKEPLNYVSLQTFSHRKPLTLLS